MAERHLKQIVTPRLILRPIADADAQALCEAMESSRAELATWMPWAKRIGLQYAQQFAHYSEISWQKREQGNFPFVIERRSDSKIIGSLGFNEYSQPKRGIFEMGYWLSTDAHGHGFATEAALALSYYAFDRLKAAVVYICVQKGNEKSIKIPERLNYAFQLTRQKACRHCITDALDDFHVYALSEKEVLPELDYHYDDLEQPRSIVDYSFQSYLSTDKTLLPLVFAQELILFPPRQEDLFHFQDFVSKASSLHGRFPWSESDFSISASKKFLTAAFQASENFSQVTDFCHVIRQKDTRQIVGLINYHMRDRSVPILDISCFWVDGLDAPRAWQQLLPSVIQFIDKNFGPTRLELVLPAGSADISALLQDHGFMCEGELLNYWRHCQTKQACNTSLWVKNTLNT